MIDEYGNDMGEIGRRVALQGAEPAGRTTALQDPAGMPGRSLAMQDIPRPDTVMPAVVMEQFRARPAVIDEFSKPSMRPYASLLPGAQAGIMGSRTEEDKRRWIDGRAERMQSAEDRHQGMKVALGEALMQHVLSPYFGALGQTAAAAQHAQGGVAMAREQGQQAIRRQEVENQGNLSTEQEAGRRVAMEGMMRAAPELMKIMGLGGEQWQSAGGGAVFNPRTGAVNRPAASEMEPIYDGDRLVGHSAMDASGRRTIKYLPVDQYASLGGGSGGAAPAGDKYVVGKRYRDGKGNEATYLGNGRWQ